MRGIRLEPHKDLLEWTFRRPPQPAHVILPFNTPQNRAFLNVSAGDKVLTGQRIAEPADNDSIPVYSSICGEIKSIGKFPHPLFGEAEAVEITACPISQNEERVRTIGRERSHWQDLSAHEILGICREMAVVELTEAMTPVHEKASGSAEVLVINACEPEPYLTNDYSMAMSHPLEVLRGADILKKCLGAKEVVVASLDIKLEAAELLKSKIFFLKWNDYRVEVLKAHYPQGTDFVLQKTFGEDKAIVFNAATAYAVYEAVVMQKPLYERTVSIAGECIIEPKNAWIRFGTTFRDAIKICRGLLREPGKILMNGPIKGTLQSGLEVPVIAATQGILALPKELRKVHEEPCIRCGLCVDVCPSEISPVMLTLASERKMYSLLEEYGAEHCFLCGNCSYICPSKRPMLELIQTGAEKAGLNLAS